MRNSIPFLLWTLLLSFPVFANQVETVPTDNFQPIKARVISDYPAEFTINVRFLTNTFADTDADVFSVYVSSTEPKNCADFRHLELSYNKPSKYVRVFNLADNPEVITAIQEYECVAIRNIPQ